MASSSSSSMGGGMSNMSRLLASSRLSSHHPNVSQVYTAPPSYIARGDFGVKRPLPTRHVPIGKIRYVGLNSLDTKEGQTEWREREKEVILLKRFSELNVKLTPKEEALESLSANSGSKREARPGSLGPRISTSYDPSTRRAVPTNYDAVADKELKEELQADARLGRGKIYNPKLVESSPLGSISGYTDCPDIRLNFRNMSENRFDKFLDEVRANREIFKEHLATRAAHTARAKVAYKYERERSSKVEEARRAQAAGATKVEVPEQVLERELPLPGVHQEDDGIQLDLWDEARLVDSSNSQWSSWLKTRTTSDVRLAESAQLPPVSNPRGGHEIPTSLHIHGGLQYGQPDSISTQALHVSVPARVLSRSLPSSIARQFSTPKHSSQHMTVAVGGRIAQMPHNLAYSVPPIDTSGNDTNRGNIRVKVVNAIRESRKELIEDLGFKRFTDNQDENLPAIYGTTTLTVRNVENEDSRSLRKGIPGSTKYIASLEGKLLQSGEGNSSILDYADQDAMTNSRRNSSGTSQLWNSIDKQNTRLSPAERQRKEKRDRLNSNTRSSKGFLNIISDTSRASQLERTAQSKPPTESSEKTM